jgi:hypothetical protein
MTQSPQGESSTVPVAEPTSKPADVAPQGIAGESPAPVQRRMSIEELEKILQREDDIALEILPNGEIRQKGEAEKLGIKPLTMRETLGGEYA